MDQIQRAGRQRQELNQTWKTKTGKKKAAVKIAAFDRLTVVTSPLIVPTTGMAAFFAIAIPMAMPVLVPFGFVVVVVVMMRVIFVVD